MKNEEDTSIFFSTALHVFTLRTCAYFFHRRISMSCNNSNIYNGKSVLLLLLLHDQQPLPTAFLISVACKLYYSDGDDFLRQIPVHRSTDNDKWSVPITWDNSQMNKSIREKKNHHLCWRWCPHHLSDHCNASPSAC